MHRSSIRSACSPRTPCTPSRGFCGSAPANGSRPPTSSTHGCEPQSTWNRQKRAVVHLLTSGANVPAISWGRPDDRRDPIAPADLHRGNDVTASDWPWLGRCVADPADFLSTHWTVRPYLEPGACSRFGDIFTIEEFDRILAMSALGNIPGMMRRVTVLKDGRYAQDDAFTKARPITHGQAPAIDCKRIAKFIRAGATIVLNTIDEATPGVFDLCSGLERELSHHVGANAYLTPPRSQGQKIHYDSHDVIVSNGKYSAVPQLWSENLNMSQSNQATSQ
jgi:hypothetical protein